MLPQCPRCRINIACKDHPSSLLAASSMFGTTGREPEPAKSLPASFRFFNPSHPITLQKPLHDHTETELSTLAAASSAKAAEKRKSNEEVESDASPTKRPCTTDRLGPTPTALRPLRSCAYDCWQSIQGCDSEELPDGTDIRAIIALDAQYQRSKRLEEFRMPLSGERLRCIHCLRDHSIWKTWAKGSATRRIREHMLKYHPNDFQARPAALDEHGDDDFGEAELAYTPELFAECLAEWIARDDQALQAIESKEFRRVLLVASRAPPLEDKDIPGRKKMAKTVHELYLDEVQRIQRELQNSRGRISITSDLWSDDVLRAFMAVTAHYINGAGDLAEHLIAFQQIKGHHTGANVGKSLFSVFEEFGIIPKIGHITLDNASPNDTLMKQLQEAFADGGVPFGHDINRIRCYAHIINLVVIAILKGLPAAAQLFREEAAAKGDDLDEDISAYLDALESGILGCCRESIKALRSSDVRREEFTDAIKDGNLCGLFRTTAGMIKILPILQLLRDSETRWSSTYNMIIRYIELYPAICHYTSSHLKIPVLSHTQVEVLDDLSSILSVLHNAQELLSAERTPTLALALPVYESLTESLQELTFEYPVFHHAIESGIRKLEGYIAKARDLPSYVFAMVVNPCMKFGWIDEHWSSPRRQNSQVLVKEQMLEYCQKKHGKKGSKALPVRTSADRAARAQHSGYLHLLNVTSTIKRGLGSTTTATQSTFASTASPQPLPPPPPLSEDEILIRHMAEVDAELLRWEQLEGYEYKTMGTLSLVEFWEARKYEFPLLYQIAMSVLPIQASSVSSERVFSSSKMTCTRERNRISPEMMEYLQVLKHSLHRRSSQNNNQTLDFIAKAVGSDSEDEGLDD